MIVTSDLSHPVLDFVLVVPGGQGDLPRQVGVRVFSGPQARSRPRLQEKVTDVRVGVRGNLYS